MTVIVGLVTGWMSGRLFLPSAFQGRNPLTDPEVMMWEVRFVKDFVSYFRDSLAIAGWDLGNECNCMDRISERSQAWVWTSLISNAVRSCDPDRPVISGMHGLSILPDSIWTQCELYQKARSGIHIIEIDTEL
jgi:endo-1,4-beta-mannosidase